MTTRSESAPETARFTTIGLPEGQRIALWEDHNAHALIGLRCHTLGEGSLEATELTCSCNRFTWPASVKRARRRASRP